jgi:hypothetical protein
MPCVVDSFDKNVSFESFYRNFSFNGRKRECFHRVAIPRSTTEILKKDWAGRGARSECHSFDSFPITWSKFLWIASWLLRSTLGFLVLTLANHAHDTSKLPHNNIHIRPAFQLESPRLHVASRSTAAPKTWEYTPYCTKKWQLTSKWECPLSTKANLRHYSIPSWASYSPGMLFVVMNTRSGLWRD